MSLCGLYDSFPGAGFNQAMLAEIIKTITKIRKESLFSFMVSIIVINLNICWILIYLHLIKYYQKQDLVKEIDGNGKIDQIHEEISNIIKSLGTWL